jgi:hypothetical protein
MFELYISQKTGKNDKQTTENNYIRMTFIMKVSVKTVISPIK